MQIKMKKCTLFEFIDILVYIEQKNNSKKGS